VHGKSLTARGARTGRVARLGAVLLVVLLALAAGAALAAVHTITRGDATAVATAVSLRQDDLPSLKQESNPVTPQQQRLAAQAAACAGGVPPSEAYANTQSPAFVSPQPSLTVASSVEILPSASLVARDFAAIERPRALTCMASELASQARLTLPKGDRLTAAAVRVPSVVPGGGESFEIRVTVTVSSRERGTTVNAPVYVDQIGFADGQAEVSLEVEATLVKPSTSLERQLATLLVARARTAIG